jgi:hypothetical protein
LPFSRADNGIRVALKVTPRAARDALGPVRIEANGTGVLKVSVQLFLARRGWATFRIFDPAGKRLTPSVDPPNGTSGGA